MDLIVADIPPGSVFSIVVRVVKYEEGILVCEGLSPAQCFRAFGAPADLAGLYTIYELNRASEDQYECFFGQDTVAMLHPEKDPFSHVTIMDFCSGMGGFSIGSQLIGMKTLVFVEKSQLACDALRANFSCPVVQGDLGLTSTIKLAHSLKGTNHLQITGGFPCQGFSRQGDMHGMDDHRSHSLHSILQGAWFLQADDILLECVATVLHFPDAMSYIDSFASAADMSLYKFTFDLQGQWPARRDRFWCHLIHKSLPSISIPRWPTTSEFCCLKDIMPLDAYWNDDEEAQLAWDPSELALYLDPSFGCDRRVLGPDDQAPTVLHSWGHVNRACPCGCRQAFSMMRLRRGGARGFGLISSKTGRHRHLHHQEGAMLCTVPPTYQFPMPPRAALSLLGQIAAPLQVLWVQAHILAALQEHHWGYTNIDPEQAIRALQHGLKHYAATRWITPSHHVPREIQLHIVDTNILHTIKIESPMTVGHLLKAEKALAGWRQYATLTHDGQRLHPHDLLQTGILYQLQIHTSIQARPFPLSTNLSGGGDVEAHMQLGDRLLWTFMQAMINEVSAHTQEGGHFSLYPFSANQFLRMTLPQQVAKSWQQRRQRESGDVHIIVELHGHWLYLHGLWTSSLRGLSWTLYDGLRMGQAIPWMLQVTQKLTQALDSNFLGLHQGHSLPQQHNMTCGTLALLHMAQTLGMLSAATDDQILQLHFWLLSQQTSPSEIMAGGNDDTHRQLAQLLTIKGVPSEAAEDRAHTVITKLGHRSVQQILKAKNPWNELKAAASKPGTMFRLISFDEQKAYIAERAQTKHGARIPNHKAKKQQKGGNKASPVFLDPTQFELNANHFKDDNDLPVGQIHYDEVETEARGVALCTTDMAHRFLVDACSISTDALALLLLDTPTEEQLAATNTTPIIIPAKFKGTDEHTLIYGHILQLGDNTVSRELASKDSTPEVVETKVIKLQAFRDQINMPWNRFAEAPIRALVSTMDALQLCKGAKCGTGCNKFHPGLDETIENVIFEIWARSFYDESGRKTSQDQACLFTTFMRIPEGALHKLLTTAPTGVYIEPRGNKPREQDDQYRVVWLPGASADEAAHQCRTYEKAICMVRLKNKYGIRVKQGDEKAAWAHLRPGLDFVSLNIQLIFELFPIPHGTQRHSIVKLLRDWSWEARPLQPGKGNFHHMSWRVGASQPPPQSIMTGFQNDVVITQIKELKPPEPQQQLIASSKTHRHLRATPTSKPPPKGNIDPWHETGKDPWAPNGPKPSASNTQDGKQRLAELQEKLKHDLSTEMAQQLETHAQAAVQAAAASSLTSTSNQDQRIAALEVGLKEIKGQNAQFNQWFQQAGERLQSTENTLNTMQQTINTHTSMRFTPLGALSNLL